MSLVVFVYIIAISFQVAGAILLIRHHSSTKRDDVIRRFVKGKVTLDGNTGELKYRHDKFVEEYRNGYLNKKSFWLIFFGYVAGIWGKCEADSKMYILFCIVLFVSIIVVYLEKKANKKYNESNIAYITKTELNNTSEKPDDETVSNDEIDDMFNEQQSLSSKTVKLKCILFLTLFLYPCCLFANGGIGRVDVAKLLFDGFGCRIGQSINFNNYNIIKAERTGGEISITVSMKSSGVGVLNVVPDYINGDKNKVIVFGMTMNIDQRELPLLIGCAFSNDYNREIHECVLVGKTFCGFPNILISYDKIPSIGICDLGLRNRLKEKRFSTYKEIDDYVEKLYLTKEEGAMLFDVPLLDNNFYNTSHYEGSSGVKNFMITSFMLPKGDFGKYGYGFTKYAKGELVSKDGKKIKIQKPFGMGGYYVTEKIYKELCDEKKCDSDYKYYCSFDEALSFL